MTIHFHKHDLPKDVKFKGTLAIDTETTGLNLQRDKLCVVQLSAGDGDAHVIQINRETFDAPNLKKVLSDPKLEKLFHFARFDIAAIYQYLGILCEPVYCTKLASFLCRTYSDKHSLRELCKELLGIEMNKQSQTSDWAADDLSQNQIDYAASDVLYLHQLRKLLDDKLQREGRMDYAKACFKFLPTRALLDLAGWNDQDIFAHTLNKEK